MDNRIEIQIFGAGNWIVNSGCGGCSSKGGNGSKGCGGCSSGGCGGGCSGGHGSEGGCGSKVQKTIGELYEDLSSFLGTSDIKDNVRLEFLDIRKINVLDYDDIRVLYDMNYELPYCVVDGIVRYYGGISNELIYSDIKELLKV